MKIYVKDLAELMTTILTDIGIVEHEGSASIDWLSSGTSGRIDLFFFRVKMADLTLAVDLTSWPACNCKVSNSGSLFVSWIKIPNEDFKYIPVELVAGHGWRNQEMIPR